MCRRVSSTAAPASAATSARKNSQRRQSRCGAPTSPPYVKERALVIEVEKDAPSRKVRAVVETETTLHEHDKGGLVQGMHLCHSCENSCLQNGSSVSAGNTSKRVARTTGVRAIRGAQTRYASRSPSPRYWRRRRESRRLRRSRTCSKTGRQDSRKNHQDRTTTKKK